MNQLAEPIQTPAPGTQQLMFRGDIITFTLALAEAVQGRAWIRTTIGHAATARRTVISQVLHDIQPLGEEWYDIPMERQDDRNFAVTLPLNEVGHFEAKCFFLAEDRSDPTWAPGPDTVINVEPADTCAANIIYNAFVRQFGPNKDGSARADETDRDCIERLDQRQYTVIPKSGTFRDLIRELDFIINELGCRVLQLLPIHPTPTTYGRMGRFGSPFAALNFTGVDPALAEFDPRATPLEQFTELLDAVHARHGRVFLDIAVNHMGWAANLHETHPHWLVRDKNGEIQVPGAWGIQWSDLTSLDYGHKDLWLYIAEVFLTWCRRGVDGFRCDAGYMIPVPAWIYIVSAVREQFPDTVFLLEGLGGKISVTREILDRANFNWAYSELFQNYDRGQIEHYLPGAMTMSEQVGNLVHFAETHDNNRLAATGPAYAAMRTALCALCSHQGGFGFANGVEWLADVKIDVHQARPLNWGAAPNLVGHLRRLNQLLRTHPAFFPETEVAMIQQGPGNFIVVRRHHRPGGKMLVIAVNLDDHRPVSARWQEIPGLTDDTGRKWYDLLNGEAVHLERDETGPGCFLDPGQVRCLSPDPADRELVSDQTDSPLLPARVTDQKRRAVLLDIFCAFHGTAALNGFDMDAALERLRTDPVECCRFLNPDNEESRVCLWQWPQDQKRQVMVLPGHFLIIRAPHPFRAMITATAGPRQKTTGCQESLPAGENTFFVLFPPEPPPESAGDRALEMTVYQEGRGHHVRAVLRYLPDPDRAGLALTFLRHELAANGRLMLAANGRGAMCRANADWGRLNSKYDALLAANLSPVYPEDRWIMFTRCRAWAVYQDFSQEIRLDCLESFQAESDGGRWQFTIPTGQGESIDLAVWIRLVPGENRVDMEWHRASAAGRPRKLGDIEPVKLIFRPDIDDRNFHTVTKAYTGPEHRWPTVVTPETDAFSFAPDPARRLRIRVPGGRFVSEPEWQYLVEHPLETERGLEAASDLFSPGYFAVFLTGGQTAVLTARIDTDQPADPPEDPVHRDSADTPDTADSPEGLTARLRSRLRAYLVQRGDLLSVIAGYPWFLDWGRDSLIVARGLITAGLEAEAASVLKQFGRLEKDGTLPNMISGQDAANRDTSDAPLWFCAACADMAATVRGRTFFDEYCGDRTIREILLNIGRRYVAGTPNGIAMDTGSGLIFSPAHFTWMDTDHPAGTPRQGYAVEIQALWYAALHLLGDIDPDPAEQGRWKDLAEKIQASLARYFYRDEGFLADCLHAEPGQPAARAVPDDALRPNQLLAIALGAVTDTGMGRNMVEHCRELLIPGAIRSLADRPLRHPLAIRHHGQLLNDPHHPYQGRYQGDEDTRRKPAYHNGTAWTWPFPVFCEAWVRVYGKQARSTARAWMTSSLALMEDGCAGHLPEILDGDHPHHQRGCDAQAWGLSEWLRVWIDLERSQ